MIEPTELLSFSMRSLIWSLNLLPTLIKLIFPAILENIFFDVHVLASLGWKKDINRKLRSLNHFIQVLFQIGLICKRFAWNHNRDVYWRGQMRRIGSLHYASFEAIHLSWNVEVLQENCVEHHCFWQWILQLCSKRDQQNASRGILHCLSNYYIFYLILVPGR